ncbi:MAG: ECF transporter S component, partial [Bifidobacterium boum]|nr:ECF transporter S component [Bifidobacterium boum]
MAQAANTAASSTVNLKWRVVDIAVASVIGVASALIYWLVALLTAAPWTALDAVVPGLPGLFNGLWLFAGPLAAIIVRKPGAAVYA